MRTTFDIADNILERARAMARREGLTLRALVEEGLRSVLERRGRARPAPVRPVTFKGKGLQPAFRSASWDRIREAAYGLPPASGGGAA